MFHEAPGRSAPAFCFAWTDVLRLAALAGNLLHDPAEFLGEARFRYERVGAALLAHAADGDAVLITDDHDACEAQLLHHFEGAVETWGVALLDVHEHEVGLVLACEVHGVGAAG